MSSLRERGLMILLAFFGSAGVAYAQVAPSAPVNSTGTNGWTIGAGTYSERQDYRSADARIFLRWDGKGAWRFSEKDAIADPMVEQLGVDLTLPRVWLDADPETFASRDQGRSNAANNLARKQRRYLCATPNRLFTDSKIEDRVKEGYNVCTSRFRSAGGGFLGLDGVEIDRIAIEAAIESAGGFKELQRIASASASQRRDSDAAAMAPVLQFQATLRPGVWTSCGMVQAISEDLAHVQRFDGSTSWLAIRKLTPRGHPVVDCTPARR